MFCHKCGTQIAEGAIFCHKCGTKVVHADTKSQASDSYKPDNPAPATPPHKDILRCPNCHSSDLIPVTETKTDVSGGGYGVGKGCCGWILLGPFGLLCGLCGTEVKSHTRTITSWVCKDCGNKFRNPVDVKAEEKAEQMATCISILGGSGILYIAGNLLADNGLELFGIPNWIYITLGVLGIILGALGALASALDDMNIAGEPNELAKKALLAAVIVSIASFLSGIIFAITGVRFFWIPAWIYILFGLLGGIFFAFMLFFAWGLGASEEDLDAFDKKYTPLLQKIISVFDKKK